MGMTQDLTPVDGMTINIRTPPEADLERNAQLKREDDGEADAETDGRQHGEQDAPLHERPGEELQPNYPTGLRFAIIVFALCLVGFLISLDTTVVATAASVISDDFDSLGDIGWYSSTYFLAMCVPQISLVKLYDRFPIRWIYSTAIIVFMAGSALCGGAPNSAALVAGRAVAGIGAARLYSGNNALVPYLAPPKRRPVFFGLFLGAMGLGLGSGPLIGGVLTERVTWRWNFYLNLPVSGFVYVIFLLFVHPHPNTGAVRERASWPEFIRSLDIPGLVLLTPSLLCLILALQWGGSKHPWHSGPIIVLLSLAGVLALAFLAKEFWQGPYAMLPARIMTQRNIICAVCFCFFCNAATAVLNYYLPIWFQGVRGATPIESGVDTLPIVVMTSVSSILCGGFMTIWGHVGPSMVLGSLCLAVGTGLLTTLSLATSTGRWVGYELLCAVGCAAGRLCPSVALQSILDPQDVSYGYTMLTFTASMGGAIFVSVAEALFENYLLHGLEALGLSEQDVETALAGGVTMITSGLSGPNKTAVLRAVNEALAHVWILAVVLSCLGIVGAVGIQHSKIQGLTREEES